MPAEILDSGPNHTVDIMALYLERTSYDVVVFFPLTWSDYRHFLKQNSAIQQGSVKGATINLKYLGIGNGLTVQSSVMPRLLTNFFLTTSIRTHFRNTQNTSNTLS